MMEDFACLKKKRGVLGTKLTTFKNYVSKVEKPISNQVICELKLRTDRFSNLLCKFDAVQTQIEIHDKNTIDQITEREYFEDQYYSMLPNATQFVES